MLVIYDKIQIGLLTNINDLFKRLTPANHQITNMPVLSPTDREHLIEDAMLRLIIWKEGETE